MRENNVDKNVINAYNGGQVIIANDNATVYAVQNNGNTSNEIHLPVKSRTQEYADKWNENMFLNDSNRRDENYSKNVKLKHIYPESQLPHYIWKKNTKQSDDLKELLFEYIYMGSRKNKMLLILGQPGIGKSTLITWITANFISRIENILIYRFASDLNEIDWENTSLNYNVSKEILKKLGLEYDFLEGKILILDGFDEINISNDRAIILDRIYRNLIVEGLLTGFSLIITCRENCIQNLQKIECDYITLQLWDREQIYNFCDIYQSKANNFVTYDIMDNIKKNEGILGIPLILYMVLALNIFIDKEGSIVDVYDQIFSLKGGGIYERCINNIHYEDGHRINEIKNYIHQISREIAIWMFENNPDRAFIPQEQYQKICRNVIRKNEKENKNIEKDFLIGNYFKLVSHCEELESNKLYFVHRSIYEYFVAETIYNLIEKPLIELTLESQEKFGGNIAKYLKQGKISNTISEYLKYKIFRLYNTKLSLEKRNIFYLWWESAIDKMMDVGMFFCTGDYICNYRNVMSKENICFTNLLEILRALQPVNRNKYILEGVNKRNLKKYIRNYLLECEINTQIVDLRNVYLDKFRLKGIISIMADFEGAYLGGADLSYSKLIGANFRNTDLRNTNFKNADLRGAHLDGADLRGADLQEADLEKVSLDGTVIDKNQVDYFEKSRCNLRSVNIYYSTMQKCVSYKMYHLRNK